MRDAVGDGWSSGMERKRERGWVWSRLVQVEDAHMYLPPVRRANLFMFTCGVHCKPCMRAAAFAVGKLTFGSASKHCQVSARTSFSRSVSVIFLLDIVVEMGWCVWMLLFD